MPVFEQGYVPWQGKLQPAALRWWPILKLHLLGLIKKRLVLFLLGLSMLGMLGAAMPIMMASTFGARIPGGLISKPKIAVTVVRFLQGQWLWVMLLSVFVGSGLVARDLQTGSMRLYLSRPLTRLDYFLGKFGVLAAFLAVPTLLPGLLLLMLHALVNEDFGAFGGSALTAVLLTSGAYILLGGGIALAASSVTSSPRIAGISCLGVWLLGFTVADSLHRAYPGDWPQVFDPRRVVGSIGERLIQPLVLTKSPHWDNPLTLELAGAIIGGVLLACILLLRYRMSEVSR